MRGDPRKADERIEIQALLASRRTCCICHDPRKSVQLHHIDGNRSRTIKANLAVLCLDHHHEATAGLERGRVGLSRKLTPTEIRAAKSLWEQHVAGELAIPKKTIAWHRRRQLQTLMDFELIKWKAEIRSLGSSSEVRKKFKFLEEFCIEEFISGVPYRRPILKALTDVALVSVGEMIRSLPLISVLRVFSWHLIGPHEVRMSKEDKFVVTESLKVLETVASYAAEFQDNPRLLRESCSCIVELGETAFAYRSISGLKRGMRTLRAVRRNCRDYEPPRGASSANKVAAVKQRTAIVNRSIQRLEKLEA